MHVAHLLKVLLSMGPEAARAGLRRLLLLDFLGPREHNTNSTDVLHR